jgi:DNA-binding beta-propeller fold protein YncE
LEDGEMMEQVNAFLSKKPDRKTLIIAAVILVLLCLCCLCLLLALWRGVPLQPTPTSTPTATATATATATLTPSVTNTFTPTGTLTPSPTPSLTPSETPTLIPTVTSSPTITPTENPLSGPEHLAIFSQTGSVWVTSRKNNRLVELDGGDLHVLAVMDIDSPNGIAIWQERGLAYIANRNRDTVSEVDLYAHSITRTIAVGKEPLGVTVVQGTGVVFVANNASNTVSCIPPDTNDALVATPRRIELQGPTSLFGFAYNTDIPNTAIVVDSSGNVALAWLNVGSLSFRSVSADPCILSAITTIDQDRLADVTQSSANDLWFFVTDRSANKVVLLPNIGDLSTPTEFILPDSPYAISDFGRCVGVMVPGQNSLYLLDPGIQNVLKQVQVGKQGNNGGQGLAYNSQTDTAYVANAADNSVTRIPNPCR